MLIPISVIALPSLGYHPFIAWQHDPATDSFMWPRDSLPRCATGAQVFLYGYDGEIQDDDAPISVESIANLLISGLRGIGRSSLSAKPLVFLAHSLGGVVLKQCLVELANAGESEMFMLRGVSACVFMAVPNRLPGPGELAAMVSSKRFSGFLKELQAARNVGYLSSLSGMVAGIAQANQIRMCWGYETVGSVITKEPHHATFGDALDSALLLRKEQSIQHGTKSSDEFPIAKAHCDVLRLQPGSQTIEMIASYVREASGTAFPQVAATKNRKDESGPWHSLGFSVSWAGLVSLFNSSGSLSPRHFPINSLRPLRRNSMNVTDMHWFPGASSRRPTQSPIHGGSENDPDIEGSLLHNQLLSTLLLHGREREEAISQASTGTFNWIWTDDFASWLTDARPLFWIRGKPGSGKSTLMRYIWDHDELSRLLRNRSQATHAPMIKAAFFFHYRGSHVQKAFEGMLHSILFRILEQEPRLAKALLLDFAKLELRQRELWTWNLPRLMAAYEAVLIQHNLPVDLVLFIDALDEYDGPAKAMVDFIRTSLEKSSQGVTRLKVCFSSREWTAFEENFTREPGFKIHEHTQDDIRNYISSRLSSAGWTEDEGSDMHEMVQTLTERANGVFIWVRAVLDEICRLFSKTTPTKQVLQYLEAVPDDLNQLYTDAVSRIPHEYRREAYFMFEVILRATDRSLDTFELVEVVSCAGHESLDECLRANRVLTGGWTSTRTRDYSVWVKERGAGLVKLVASGDNGNESPRPRVQFMHQTVVDFVSQPGFRGILLGRTFDLPLENGYSLLAKWLFARAQELAGIGSATGLAPTTNVLALAESTTGRSMKRFLDALDPRVLQEELCTLGVEELIAEPKIAFAAVQNLTIFLQEFIRGHNGRIPDNGGFSTLHCVCRVANWPQSPLNPRNKYYVGGSGMGTEIVFPCEMPVEVPVASLLLRHGASVDVTYKGETPWQILFRGFHSHKFSTKVIQDSPRINALARHLLMAGQDPNVDVLISGRKVTIGKALHVAPRGLAELLLEFGARVNALDGKGHTPLDLACRVRTTYRYSMAPHIQKEEPARREVAYDLAVLLMSHGAKVTRRGQRKWCYLCDKSNLWSGPQPSVLHLSEAILLVENMKRLRAWIKLGHCVYKSKFTQGSLVFEYGYAPEDDGYALEENV